MNDLHDLELLLRYNRPILIKRNLRLALQIGEVMVPCILRLDEIEKGLAAGSAGDGLGQHILDTLLSWMAERKAAVFLVATSNDITHLPPELARQGRLDEIFFVDLPDQSVRRAIFAIHLRRRDRAYPAPLGGHGPARSASCVPGPGGAQSLPTGPDRPRRWTPGATDPTVQVRAKNPTPNRC